MALFNKRRGVRQSSQEILELEDDMDSNGKKLEVRSQESEEELAKFVTRPKKRSWK